MPRPRIFPRSRSRGSATASRRSASAPITAWRCCRRCPAEEIVRGLPGMPRTSRRAISRRRFGEVRVASIYLPNGNPVGTDKFTYKLAWMERLVGHARELLRREIPFVLAGDYNICPADEDVYDPVAFRDDALCRHGGALAVPRAALSRADRRLPGLSPRAAPLYVLGLPGRTLASRRGAAHRPSAAVAACGRPGRRVRHRQDAAAPRNAPRTTPRSGASSRFEQNLRLQSDRRPGPRKLDEAGGAVRADEKVPDRRRVERARGAARIAQGGAPGLVDARMVVGTSPTPPMSRNAWRNIARSTPTAPIRAPAPGSAMPAFTRSRSAPNGQNRSTRSRCPVRSKA